MKLEFLDRFSKIPQLSNSMKIRPVGDEFLACGKTDMMKLTVAFRNFANAPIMYIGLHVQYRYSCPILVKLELLDRFSKNIEMIIRPASADLFHADGQTDRQTWAS